MAIKHCTHNAATHARICNSEMTRSEIRIQAKIWRQEEKSRGFTSVLARMVLCSKELGTLLNEPLRISEKPHHDKNQNASSNVLADETILNKAVHEVKIDLENHKIGVDKIVKDLSNQNQNASSNAVLDETILNKAVHKVKIDLKNHKIGVDKTVKDLSNTRKNLQRAQNDAAIQKRTIQVCKREIDNHCCQCGGLHIFADHAPTQREGCKRLKNKVRSLMYLKHGLKEATERVNICQIALDNGSAQNHNAQASMTASLSQGLSLIESIMDKHEYE
jgi:hypothetical protein